MLKIKVIYIGPIGYSGSTLMERILSRFDGIYSIGEAKFFDEWIEKDLKCTCGEKMSECSFWTDFIHQFPDYRMGDCKGNFKLNFLYKKPANFISKSKKIGEKSRFLFDFLLRKTGNHIIVDSSKNLGRLSMLAQSGLFDLKIIQMIRDGRDVCGSMKIIKDRPSFEDDRKTKSQPVWKSAIRWRLAHHNLKRLTNEYDIPLKEIRLEDIVNEKELSTIMIELAHFLNTKPQEISIIGETHSISGSHWRFLDKNQIFSNGTTKQKNKISAFETLIFNLIAGKLNRKFGYK